MSEAPLQVGERVVFTKTKHSVSPGPRAREVSPSSGGDTYTYVVDKLWIVAEIQDGQATLRTRRGKLHQVAADDPRLRRPTWFERLRYFGRFPD